MKYTAYRLLVMFVYLLLGSPAIQAAAALDLYGKNAAGMTL